MRLEQVAAQTYTVRDYLKTPEDIASSLNRIRGIGYPAVQLSGLGPVETPELKRILEGEGLTCCATHEPADEILDQPEQVAERLHQLDCRYTAYPYPAGWEFKTIDDVYHFAGRLNHAGQVLLDAGVVLTYHNHHIEFQRFGGRPMLEILYDRTDPRYVRGEIDTYWVQYGGGSPADWCRRLKARLPLLHLKDYAVDPEYNITFAEIGSGNLDWNDIISAARQSGCLWYIVEQDTCPGNPFDSLKKSLDFIQKNLLCD